MTEQEYIEYFEKQIPKNTFECDNFDDFATMLWLLEKHGYLGALDWGQEDTVYDKQSSKLQTVRQITWVAEKSFSICADLGERSFVSYEPLVGTIFTIVGDGKTYKFYMQMTTCIRRAV